MALHFHRKSPVLNSRIPIHPGASLLCLPCCHCPCHLCEGICLRILTSSQYRISHVFSEAELGVPVSHTEMAPAQMDCPGSCLLYSNRVCVLLLRAFVSAVSPVRFFLPHPSQPFFSKEGKGGLGVQSHGQAAPGLERCWHCRACSV